MLWENIPQNKVGKQKRLLSHRYRGRESIVGRETWQWSRKAWLKSRKLANHIVIHTEKGGRELEPGYNTSVLPFPTPTGYILILPPKDSVIFPNSDTNREPRDQTYETIGDFSYSKHHKDLGRFERKYFRVILTATPYFVSLSILAIDFIHNTSNDGTILVFRCLHWSIG